MELPRRNGDKWKIWDSRTATSAIVCYPLYVGALSALLSLSIRLVRLRVCLIGAKIGKIWKGNASVGNFCNFAAVNKLDYNVEHRKHTRNLFECPHDGLGAPEGTYPQVRLAG